ncbi:ATP-dependent Clp protease adaptor protein ClpS [Chthonomonas calidirosea]|nr:ATP-dependent Clp protease adaptor protein ClpS [Chthonomonas calidirosea]
MLRKHQWTNDGAFVCTEKAPLLVGVAEEEDTPLQKIARFSGHPRIGLEERNMGLVENSIKALPKGEELESTGGSGAEWIVVVYDNDYNTVEEVIRILIAATHCSFEEAAIETWEIHHLGKSVVHHADKEECERVASIIATIGIRVEVRQE